MYACAACLPTQIRCFCSVGQFGHGWSTFDVLAGRMRCAILDARPDTNSISKTGCDLLVVGFYQQGGRRI